MNKLFLNEIVNQIKMQPKAFESIELFIKILLSNIKTINIFFIKENAREILVEATENIELNYEPLNLPFKNIWLAIAKEKPEDPEINIHIFEEEPTKQYVVIFAKKNKNIYFSSMIIQDRTLHIPEDSNEINEQNLDELYTLLKIIFNRLTKKNLIFTEPKEDIIIRTKFDKQKYFYRGKPNNIVYVGYNKQDKKELGLKEITSPSHQYEVMGHWRKLIKDYSIGKDREGQRTVKGYTWVNPFVKGPEGTALIKKVRVVKCQ